MEQMIYKAGFPGILYAGEGSAAQIPEIIARMGAGRVGLLVDSAVRALREVQSLCGALGDALVGVYQDIPPEPTFGDIETVYRAVLPWRAQALIAIGGGSVMDMCKAVAAALTNPAFAEAGFADPARITTPPISSVMAPTTAGTGAEATPNAIFLRPEQSLKIGVVSDAFVAARVILDPCLTRGLPSALTATTGIDALCHAVESFVSRAANPVSRTFSLRAAGLIGGHLERAFADGGDMRAREGMLLGSFFAGMCLSSSTTVAVHALSYPLGGTYHIPHGMANAVLLPAVLRANRAACASEYAALLQAMLPGERTPMDDEQAADAFIAYIGGLCRRLQIPASLTGLGVRHAELDALTDGAFAVQRLLSQNPRVLEKADIRKIYETLL